MNIDQTLLHRYLSGDASEEEKKQATVEDLMQKFHDDLDDDRILLREE